MSEDVLLREIQSRDYPELEKIISDTWQFDAYCPEKTAVTLAREYLAACLCDQTWTRVAIADGKPVGVIMGNNVRTHRTPAACALRRFFARAELMLRREGMDMVTFYDDVDRIDSRLLKESGREYDGELSLFAVDASCRRQGIGHLLYDALMDEFRREGVRRFYLYTDTDCDVGFYESRGLHRRCEERKTYQNAGQTLVMTLYLYDNLPEGA